MSQSSVSTSGLVRVTVASGTRRVDLVLPGAVPVAELVPELARSVGLLDSATVYGGYRVVTSDGRRLVPDSGLTLQGVEDGSVVMVTAGIDEPVPPVYDDVVEAMTDVVEQELRPWDPASGRRTALAAAVLLLALGAVTLLLLDTDVAAAAAAVVAVVMVSGAIVLSRAQREAEAAVTVAWTGVGFAVLAAVMLAPDDGPFYGYPVAAAGGAALAVALVCLVGWGRAARSSCRPAWSARCTSAPACWCAGARRRGRHRAGGRAHRRRARRQRVPVAGARHDRHHGRPAVRARGHHRRPQARRRQPGLDGRADRPRGAGRDLRHRRPVARARRAARRRPRPVRHAARRHGLARRHAPHPAVPHRLRRARRAGVRRARPAGHRRDRARALGATGGPRSPSCSPSPARCCWSPRCCPAGRRCGAVGSETSSRPSPCSRCCRCSCWPAGSSTRSRRRRRPGPPMATKKDLVEAYSFSRRRLVTAFVSGAPGGREVEPSRPGRTIVGGIALAVLMIAGAAVLGILTNRDPGDWEKVGLVSEKETGANYVILTEDGPLRPVVNITSAMLLLGPDLEKTDVGRDAIADKERGEPIGILQAPGTPPASGHAAAPRAGRRARAVTPPPATGSASRSRCPPSRRSSRRRRPGFVVRSGGRLYLVAESLAGTERGVPRAYYYEITQRQRRPDPPPDRREERGRRTPGPAAVARPVHAGRTAHARLARPRARPDRHAPRTGGAGRAGRGEGRRPGRGRRHHLPRHRRPRRHRARPVRARRST